MSNYMRPLVKIDEDKCDGCGECLPHCAEGALEIVNGKARLVAEKLCDGLGACLGHCPKGAITIIDQKADAFSEEAVNSLAVNSLAVNSLKASYDKSRLNILSDKAPDITTSGCPGARVQTLRHKTQSTTDQQDSVPSALSHWPVQLRLLPPTAPSLQNAVLLLAADCAPVACADFHSKLLQGKAVVISCPKLDDINISIQRLRDIVLNNNIKGIVVAHMEVPCCTGLIKLAQQACQIAGKDIPISTVEISIEGNI